MKSRRAAWGAGTSRRQFLIATPGKPVCQTYNAVNHTNYAKQLMKTSMQNKSNKPIPPGLFQMAASLDASPLSQTSKPKPFRSGKNPTSVKAVTGKSNAARSRDIEFRL